MSVENARLWEKLKEKEKTKSYLLDRVIVAQEEERRRVAQELHDEAGQSLTSLLVELRALEFTGDRGAFMGKTAELRALVAESLLKVQNLALELRPSMLDDMGLVAALRRYIHDYASRHSLDVDFQTSGVDELRLRPPMETAVYRIIQEALTNIARHAEAKSVSVVLTRRNQDLVVLVEDDGKGFVVGEVLGRPEFSLGLRGMEERASVIWGSLNIDSEPGRTSVFVKMPLD